MTDATISVLVGLRLLVVEDEFMIAEHIGMLLEDFGCDVAGPVATIEEALAAVDEGGLDGALLDANLDGESTAPIAAALRAASVRFVVVTGYGAHELADEALNHAPRIIKPFSTAELEATLVGAFTR
ncbi:response regulator [Mesorhizobium sp. INR15]|uniref:response regulator n=1 Tax=Mesorhizobium sp. INR15 TaxID=2654248 RepID=UPI0018964258|nr:response regulator [Mesorhizobium sp. INR15]QPC95940.1 response regulator [Mesorhizobium sp. INR15]